jgi:hypothetical protein
VLNRTVESSEWGSIEFAAVSSGVTHLGSGSASERREIVDEHDGVVLGDRST